MFLLLLLAFAKSVSHADVAGDRQFVLITGLYSELRSQGNTILSSARQNPRIAATSLIEPPSNSSIEKNAGYVAGLLRYYYFQNGSRPILVVGYSKGGAELMTALLRYPELIKSGMIDKAVFLQGAFGSELSGRIYSICVKIPLMDFIDRCAEARQASDGLKSLGDPNLREQLHHKFNQLNSDSKYALNTSVLYVTAKVDPKELSALSSAYVRNYVYYWIKKKEGENDGALAQSDQSLPWFGKIILNIDAEHSELLTNQTRSGQFQKVSLVTTAIFKSAGYSSYVQLAKK
jgi:pimeloyl-ACP methyl ester carboxylesterase